jgi:hypothetical protein
MGVDFRLEALTWQVVVMSLEHLVGVVYFFKTLYRSYAVGVISMSEAKRNLQYRRLWANFLKISRSRLRSLEMTFKRSTA